MAERVDRPMARTTGVVIKAVADEMLVYDLVQHRAHSLNRVAAAVWRQCDGRSDAAAIAGRLHATDRLAVPEAAVRYAFAALSRAQLVEEKAQAVGPTRRELLRRLGTAAAVTLPVVASITVSTAAHAQSCPGLGAPCSPTVNCCPGLACSGEPGACGEPEP